MEKVSKSVRMRSGGGGVGLLHQAFPQGAICLPCCTVWVNTICDLSKKLLKLRRGSKVRCLRSLTVSCSISFPCLFAGLSGGGLCFARIVSLRNQLSDLGIPFVQLRIEDANLAKVSPLEGCEVSFQVG